MTITTTAVESTTLIEELWQSRSAEHALVGLLTNTQPLAHVDTAYRDLLADEAEYARQRLHDLDARLAALGQSGLVSTTMSAVRDLADDTLEVSMAAVAGGLQLLRRDPVEPRLVHAARTQAAAAAYANACYRVLIETARASGDAITGQLALRCHTATGELLTRLDDVMPSLVTDAHRAAGHRPSYRAAASTATARVRGAAEHLGHDVEQDRRTLADILTGWWQRRRRTLETSVATDIDIAEEEAEEEIAGHTGTAGEQPLPIPDYDHLTANRVVEQLPRLSPDELDIIEEYELAHANRVTVLNKIHALTEGGTKP